MKPIWIVDDDHAIRFVLEKALAREGLAVRSFTNAREVLAALDASAPQVLVSDIRMPGGSGLDLLAKVKERLPGLPVIVMTAYSDLDSAVSAFQSGAFEYLPTTKQKTHVQINISLALFDHIHTVLALGVIPLRTTIIPRVIESSCI